MILSFSLTTLTPLTTPNIVTFYSVFPPSKRTPHILFCKTLSKQWRDATFIYCSSQQPACPLSILPLFRSLSPPGLCAMDYCFNHSNSVCLSCPRHPSSSNYLKQVLPMCCLPSLTSHPLHPVSIGASLPCPLHHHFCWRLWLTRTFPSWWTGQYAVMTLALGFQFLKWLKLHFYVM